MAARETAPHLVTEFAGRARAFVQVQQGCDHRCTFCIIPFGRGPNRSVPIGAVVAQVRALVAGRLPGGGADRRRHRLLRRRPAGRADAGPDWRGGCWRWCRNCRGCGCRRSIRRRSTTTSGGCSAEEPRLMPHLHLSLQAGSDLILKRMKRRHLRADALAAIERARDAAARHRHRRRPDRRLPDRDRSAVRARRWISSTAAELPFLHVFPYSERPGTPAARMPAVPMPVRRERAARLREAGQATAARFLRGAGRAHRVAADRDRRRRAFRAFRPGAAGGARRARAG